MPRWKVSEDVSAGGEDAIMDARAAFPGRSRYAPGEFLENYLRPPATWDDVAWALGTP